MPKPDRPPTIDLPITPLKQRRVSEEVADQLREAIFSGRIEPGDKLPPERQLAQQFRVSRLVLREALRSLERVGMLVIKRGYGGGAFVSAMDKSAVSRSLSVVIRFGETSLDDLTEARLIYEPEIARLAAERATEEDLAIIKRLVEEQKAKLTGDTFGHPTNLSFHRLIAEATKNPVLVILVDAVMEPVGETVEHLRLPRGANQKTLSAHERLYRAIKAHNPDLAYRIMLKHVLEVREMLRQAHAGSR
jgi:GntR family transcriptional repressor for pyruvate dehydrogenase complex